MRIIKFKWSITLALVIGAEALLNRIRRSSSQATAVQALLSLPGWLGGAAGIWWGGAAQLPAFPVNICQVDLAMSVTYLLDQHLGSQSWEPMLLGGK